MGHTSAPTSRPSPAYQAAKGYSIGRTIGDAVAGPSKRDPVGNFADAYLITHPRPKNEKPSFSDSFARGAAWGRTFNNIFGK